MVTVAEMRRRFDTIDLVDLTADAIVNNERQVVGLNIEQMDKGLRADGQMIGDYAPSTILVKRAEGKEWRFVTLQDTGSFKSKMEANVIGDEIVFDSIDAKTPEIVAKYTDDIFGLTSENKRKAWIELLSPEVVKRIKDITGAI